MLYFVFILAVAALWALHKFLPNRRIFVYFCATLALVFCFSAYIQGKREQQEIISRAEIENIRKQQQIFSEWYADYQKDLEHLDRNWQLYHSLISNVKSSEVYELSTYEQFLELESDALDEQSKIHALKIPAGLDYEYAQIISGIIKKTRLYTDAQTKTISAAAAAANPEVFSDLKSLKRKLTEITIRQSPEVLFTATEISAIREKLVVPGEVVAR